MLKHNEAIAIFGGGGGSSVGAQLAGLKVLGSVDINPEALQTHEANFQGSHAVEFDMMKEGLVRLNKRSVAKAADLARRLGIENPQTWGGLILFTSPCQGFSNAGKRLLNHKLNRLVFSMFPLLEAMPNSNLLFENVDGFANKRYERLHDEFFDLLKKVRGIPLYPETLKAQYLLQASDYSLSQSRKRIIFPLRTDGYMPEKPSGTCIRVKTLRDAIHPESGFIDPDNQRRELTKYQKRLVRNMIADESPRELAARDPWVAKQARKRGWEKKGLMDNRSMFRLHKWDEPAQTIITSGGFAYGETPPLHPEKRHFTVAELTKIQGFPASYDFKGELTAIVDQIGNAVPPKMFKEAINAYFV